MTNFMFMIIVVIVLAVIILFGTVFGKQLRVKMKGRTDEVMRQDAQTPEGAKDYYNAAIREKEEFYNRASTSFAEISGKRQAAQNDLRNANKEYMRVTKQMNECIDSNNENEAMQYAMKKSTLENKINVLKDTIAEMKEAEAHQKYIMQQAADDLQRLKEEKEQVVFQMEADSQIIELHQSMDSLNMNNESERMLERVREGARKTRERAEFPADWERHGKAAGYIRNREMAQNADALVAFWDGESRGTKSMIDLAKEYDLAVRVLKF